MYSNLDGHTDLCVLLPGGAFVGWRPFADSPHRIYLPPQKNLWIFLWIFLGQGGIDGGLWDCSGC